jgi:hypothetical protein
METCHTESVSPTPALHIERHCGRAPHRAPLWPLHRRHAMCHHRLRQGGAMLKSSSSKTNEMVRAHVTSSQADALSLVGRAMRPWAGAHSDQAHVPSAQVASPVSARSRPIVWKALFQFPENISNFQNSYPLNFKSKSFQTSPKTSLNSSTI